MAHITLAGTLLAPNGSNAVGDKIRFTHKSTTGETVQSAVSILTVAPDGSYAVDLEYGLVLVEYKEASNPNFKNRGVVTVNSTNPATTIPELLNAIVPVSTAELIEFQTILANCVTAQTAAETAQAASELAANEFKTNAGAGLIGTTSGNSVQTNLDALVLGQTGGIIVFTTYALLNAYTPTTAEENTSFKVTNDSNTSLNGYYSWVSGTTYTKDADLVNGIVVSGNADATSGGTVFDAIVDSQKETNVFATNLMNNGSFQDGLAGWNSQRWTTFSAVGVFVGESNGVGTFSYTRRYPTLTVGSQYYYSYYIKSSRALNARVVISGTIDNTAIEANTWTRAFGVITATTATNQALFGAQGTLSGDIIEIDNVLLLDLDSTFGTGVKPSVLELNLLMSEYTNYYFDGESSLITGKSIVGLNDVNRTNSINITKLIPLSTGYYNSLTARAAVPSNLKVGGIKVSYQVGLNHWREDRFISSDITKWDSPEYWLSQLNNIDLYGKTVGYGAKGSNTYIDLGDDVINSYGQNIYFEFVMKASSETPLPDITYLFGTGAVGATPITTYLRRRFASRFEFAVYDSNNTRQTATMNTTVDEVTHMVVFVIGTVLTYCVNGVIIGTLPLVGGMKQYPTSRSFLRVLEDTYLFRVGTTTNVNPLERYNNGLPLEYVATDAVYETKSDGITSEYLKDNISELYSDYIDSGSTLITEDPYPSEITGSGVPAFIPQFLRQRYFDTVSNTEYIAFGRATVSDWYSLSTSRETDNKQETLVSGSNIKTINSVSVLGSGNLVVGSGGVAIQTKEAENVTAYGAVGNGVVDDTASIEAAQAASKVSGVPVVFPKGNYLITRGLIVENNMSLIGFSGAYLKRPITVTQAIAVDMVTGQNTVEVSSGSAFLVGQEILILEPTHGTGGVTYGYISSILSNTLTFTSPTGQSGAVGAPSVSGGFVVTTAVPMVRSNPTIDTVNNVVSGLNFTTQSQATDPLYYFCAIVHFNAASANTTVENCSIDSSGSDGISLQGRERMIYRNNELTDIAHNAIHFGTTGTEIIIDDNKVKNAGRNGVFFCFNNDRVIITNNHFTDCTWGMAEIDNQDNLGDRNSIIAHNTFENCQMGIGINGGYGMTIDSNIFTKMQLAAKGVYVSTSTKGAVNIKGNTFSQFNANYTGNCITINNAQSCNVNDNIINDFVGAGSPILLDNATGQCDRIIVNGNNIKSSGAVGVKIKNTLNSMVSNNIIKVSTGGTPVLLSGANTGLIEVNNIKIN